MIEEKKQFYLLPDGIILSNINLIFSNYIFKYY